MIKSILIKDYLKEVRGYSFICITEIKYDLLILHVLFRTSEDETDGEIIYMFDLIAFAYSKIK